MHQRTLRTETEQYPERVSGNTTANWPYGNGTALHFENPSREAFSAFSDSPPGLIGIRIYSKYTALPLSIKSSEQLRSMVSGFC